MDPETGNTYDPRSPSFLDENPILNEDSIEPEDEEALIRNLLA